MNTSPIPNKQSFVTRIAPSPTGHLHLGHGLHISYVQALASHFNAQVMIRIEDHDRSRCRSEYEESILNDLLWLGAIDVIPVSTNIWRQSDRNEIYQKQLDQLKQRGLVYACLCSRKEIQENIHQSQGELNYPGTCRDKNIPLDQPNTALRVKMPNRSFQFRDLILGPQSQNPALQCGDIVIRDRNCQWTYQFAVVIDDLEQGVNFIVRGSDLLSSTGRQIALREIILDRQVTPTFSHHPLIINAQGQKLSKRFLDESMASLRNAGTSADQVRGLAAYLAHLTVDDRPISLNGFQEVVCKQLKRI